MPPGYAPLVYKKDGGNTLVVASGGKIEVESGGTINDVGLGLAAGATIAIGVEATNVIAITIQLTDAAGADVASVQPVQIGVYAAATPTAFATGGSTGIAIGTDGALLALVAKKYFVATCEADGDIDLTWTDTGTEAVYLGITFPSTGKTVMSTVIACT